jgi:hypothetical protein
MTVKSNIYTTKKTWVYIIVCNDKKKYFNKRVWRPAGRSDPIRLQQHLLELNQKKQIIVNFYILYTWSNATNIFCG